MVTDYSQVLVATQPRTRAGFGAETSWRALRRVGQTLCGLHGHDNVLHYERDRFALECSSAGTCHPGWTVSDGPSAAAALRGRPRRHQLRPPPSRRVVPVPCGTAARASIAASDEPAGLASQTSAARASAFDPVRDEDVGVAGHAPRSGSTRRRAAARRVRTSGTRRRCRCTSRARSPCHRRRSGTDRSRGPFGLCWFDAKMMRAPSGVK